MLTVDGMSVDDTTVAGIVRPRRGVDTAVPAAVDPQQTPASDAQRVLLASRALVGIAARSLAQFEDQLSAMQWRVLVVVSRSEQLAVHELATALVVHPSTATRLCDQLVGKGLLARQDHPADRRYLILTLTEAGQRIVDQVNADRTRDIEAILDRVPEGFRVTLVEALTLFAEAAGEITVDPLWDLAK